MRSTNLAYTFNPATERWELAYADGHRQLPDLPTPYEMRTRSYLAFNDYENRNCPRDGQS